MQCSLLTAYKSDSPIAFLTMPQRRHLSEQERGIAIGLIRQGLSLRNVGRQLVVSQSVIWRLSNRYQQTGNVRERARSGRPRILTPQQDRFVVLAARRERTATANNIRAQLRTAANVNVSEQTIRNRLRAANLQSRRAAVRIPLTRAHRTNRLAWARIHVNWTRQQWARVIFSDESRFTLSFNDGRVRVWRRQGERFLDGAVREHNRYGGGSLMVWGGFSTHHRTPLHRVQGTLNGTRYRDDILTPIVLPSLRAVGPGSIFMDDNAPCHRSMLVSDFLRQQQVTRLDWPSCSPDLNPIEHLWDVLGRGVRRNHPRALTLDELFRQLQAEWQNIPRNTLQRLIWSMRRRCMACIAANGGHTRY